MHHQNSQLKLPIGVKTGTASTIPIVIFVPPITTRLQLFVTKPEIFSVVAGMPKVELPWLQCRRAKTGRAAKAPEMHGNPTTKLRTRMPIASGSCIRESFNCSMRANEDAG